MLRGNQVINGQKILGLIVARSGSKGLPGKNIRPLLGFPLILYTAHEAGKSKYIDKLVVSTDDWKICAAAEVDEDGFIERPPELATDRARIMDVVMHALDARPGYGWIVLLQPTSPLRIAQDIDDCIELAQYAKGAISVCRARNHPYWTYYINRGEKQPRLVGTPAPSNRQELPAAYTPNGAVYVSEVEWLRRERSFVTEETVPFIMPPERSVDIDTETDWALAEFYLKKRLGWDG